MNFTIKEKWLSALRSGKYKQGKEALRTKKNKFCCLGVLCDVYRKETKLGKWDKNPFFSNFAFINTKKNNQTFNSLGILPISVMDWAGLKNVNPTIYGNDTLSKLNDNGSTFQEIADIIEKNF
jgi:hypothetical protein